MRNHKDCPLALQQSNTTFGIRFVEPLDAHLLQAQLWQHKDIVAIREFIQRVLKFEDQGRGIGIVVTDHSVSSDMIIGYGQVTQWVKCAEISDLIVHPSYRGQGIGTAMIQYLTQYILTSKVNCIELGVAMSNPRALALYRRLGFKDSYTLQLNLGQGTEPILYLAIDLTPYFDAT